MLTHRPPRRPGSVPLFALIAPAVLAALCAPPLPAQDSAPIRTEDLRAFHPRSIGPAVTGGRIHDVEVLPGNPSVIFVASASGGLWKTTNRGHGWTNVFDTMAVSTFGDVALAPSDPRIVYAGTGEQNNRQSTSWGNGVYRSDDGGRTWRHVGLEATHHIGKILVHPEDPDVAYVAALGNLWKGSAERGVYKTTDGGRSWRKVLAGANQWTGAVDLGMDPSDPAVLYAAMYQRLRRTWGFNGGGPGSGIFKSTDGGETWTELTQGIPRGDKGRIGLAVALTDPSVVMAMIEHQGDEGTGTYRSEDAGQNWEKVNDLNPRPSYYSHIFIDPSDENRVYVLGSDAYKSEDGGRSFDVIAERPTYDVGVHSDHHALWIDPNDPNHLYLGNDGGLYESYDRGDSFRAVNNFPIGQFYAIGVDMRDPYWVYGGMQDTHSWMGPSRTRGWDGIMDDDWQQIGFHDGMYWQIDPTSHRYAYGGYNNGNYARVDAETGDMLDITPYPPEGEEYRFDWASPSLLSQHDPKTVYVGANRLFNSRNRGESWTRTEDLTRNIDRDELQLMGVYGSDIRMSKSKHDGTANYASIVTIAESPLDPDVLWVGTDDGNVQVSQDGGTTWTEVARNVVGIPDGIYVSRVVASASGRGTAYATFDGHRDGNFAPYVVRSRDFGRTWEALAEGLPSGSVNVLVEHPDNPNVLFLGTEHALFASTDAGARWARVPNLPTTPYDDLIVHRREKDLVIGTHGRSIWILDDTRPLVEWNAEVASAPLHLFSIRSGTIFTHWKSASYRGNAEFLGKNPDDGVLITYRIGPAAGGRATLTVRARDGRVVREMRVPGEAGVHRVNWNLRHALPTDSMEVWEPQGTDELPRSRTRQGPLVAPGIYQVTLQAGGQERSRPVQVSLDPTMADRITSTQLQIREAFLVDMLAILQRIEEARERAPDEGTKRDLDGLRRQAETIYDGLNGEVGAPSGSLYPPTEEHRARKRWLEQRLGQIVPGVGNGDAARPGPSGIRR